jgi:5-methylcytosine-specific restriction endonuclease McrA
MTKKRENFPDKLRAEVWERNKAICQRCKVSLIDKKDYYEEEIEKLKMKKEIPVYKWKHECWSCKKQTDMVSYDFDFLYCFHIGDINKLDKVLIEKYPFVKEVYSKTMGQMVIGNTCIYCGAYQGNFFVTEQMLDLFNTYGDEENIDMQIPNDLTPDEIPIDKQEDFTYYERNENCGHIHHKDCNPNNNQLDNLILLCRKCHFRTHAELRQK